MKRSALKRGTKPLQRKARLKARGKSRFPKRRQPEYAAWVRAQRCFADACCREDGTLLERIRTARPDFPWCQRPACVMHIRSRSAGGDDIGNILPTCWAHNDWQTVVGIQTYGQLLEQDLKAEAERLYAAYLRDREP